MNITDIFAQAGGLKSMARELGVSETQAATGAAALIPAILGGFKKQPSHSPQVSTGWAGCSGNLAGAACSTTCCRRNRLT